MKNALKKADKFSYGLLYSQFTVFCPIMYMMQFYRILVMEYKEMMQGATKEKFKCRL
jgi:hypothetical protein